jgi:hypothetical protein
VPKGRLSGETYRRKPLKNGERAAVYEPGGRTFESCRARQSNQTLTQQCRPALTPVGEKAGEKSRRRLH